MFWKLNLKSDFKIKKWWSRARRREAVRLGVVWVGGGLSQNGAIAQVGEGPRRVGAQNFACTVDKGPETAGHTTAGECKRANLRVTALKKHNPREDPPER